MSYQIPPGILSFCQGQWNEEKKKYVSDNSGDVIRCCLNTYKKPMTRCYEDCNQAFGENSKKADYYSYVHCKRHCDEIVNAAESTCLEFPSPGLRAVSNSAEKMGCGKKPLFDINCMIEKKKEIMNDCLAQCPGTEENCQEQCDSFYDYFIKGVQSPLTNITAKYHKTKEQFPSKKQERFSLFFFWFIILLLVVFIVKHN